MGPRPAGARRQHHHPAARQEPLPVAVAQPAAKFRELIIARRLEAELTKSRILELYLNVIEWGDGIYGIDAAARFYFNTPAAGLSETQSALLAGAIINPRVLNPARPTARLIRRQQIIQRRSGGVSPPDVAPLQIEEK